MDQNSPNSKNDLNEDALRDLTADEKDTGAQDTESNTSDQPTAPQSDMDVSPPPQDQVIQEPVTAPLSDSEDQSVDSSSPTDTVVSQPAQTVLPDIPSPVSAPAIDHATKKTSKGLVVAIAIVLALVLATIAILVFIKASKTTKSIDKSDMTTNSQTDTPAPATQSTDKAPVTTKDVDTTVADVDATIGALDESKDFSQEGLSDKTLGLQ